MKKCSKCKNDNPRDHRYCAPCHAENMREWRKTHNASDEQNKKQNARAYAKVYRKRGLLSPPDCCTDCASRETALEMHHEDYSKPLEITWLCRPCHLKRHDMLKAGAPSNAKSL